MKGQPVTTSDDDGYPAADDLETTHADPAEGLAEDWTTPPAATGGAGRWLLGIAASVAVILVGSALWALVYDWRNQEYVGVSVLIGLTLGWVLRTVIGRSDLPVRVLAVVLTAVGIVVGTVVGAAWFAASTNLPGIGGFWDVLPDVAPHWWDILTDKDRDQITYVIFAAALALAYLSAGPQSSKKKKAAEVTPLEDVVHDPLAGDHADPLAQATDDTAADETDGPRG